MSENNNPIVKIDDFKIRLADYVEREYPGVINREEVFKLVESVLSLVRFSGADFLDKFLVNWRGYDAMCNLQLIIACKKKNLDLLQEMNAKMWDSRHLFFGQELVDAAKACHENGDYNKWYFSTRFHMWKNGTWPIAGSRP